MLPPRYRFLRAIDCRLLDAVEPHYRTGSTRQVVKRLAGRNVNAGVDLLNRDSTPPYERGRERRSRPGSEERFLAGDMRVDSDRA
jgi:hypothetical protein